MFQNGDYCKHFQNVVYIIEIIRMDLGEIWWGGVDWTGLAQDRDKFRALVIVVMNFRVP
jgi:hypothetical protein